MSCIVLGIYTYLSQSILSTTYEVGVNTLKNIRECQCICVVKRKRERKIEIKSEERKKEWGKEGGREAVQINMDK